MTSVGAQELLPPGTEVGSRYTVEAPKINPKSAPRMPMTLRKMTIPTMTTPIKRKIRNQKQPL